MVSWGSGLSRKGVPTSSVGLGDGPDSLRRAGGGVQTRPLYGSLEPVQKVSWNRFRKFLNRKRGESRRDKK